MKSNLRIKRAYALEAAFFQWFETNLSLLPGVGIEDARFIFKSGFVEGQLKEIESSRRTFKRILREKS